MSGLLYKTLTTVYSKNVTRCLSLLKKAHKLTYSSLHPGNNKQNVKLALAIFDEATIAAVKSYFPDRKDYFIVAHQISCKRHLKNMLL